jgi:phosphatidate cytidylyltransferase
MDEQDDLDKELSKQPPAEGVRIIRADEAQAALDAGQAEGRRPGDAPRYGDAPPPPPAGPRPAHRFPLPDSVDPASVAPRPPVRIDEIRAAASRRIRETGMAAAEGAPPADDQHFADTDDRWGPAASHMSSGPGHQAGHQAGPPEKGPDLSLPEEGITVRGGSGPELPHWTDPPTGEVPRLRRDAPASSEPGEDDLAAWQALGTRGLRWRDGGSDWDDLEDVGALGGDEPRLGALDTSRTEHSDVFSFDDHFEQMEETRPGLTGSTHHQQTSAAQPTGPPPPPRPAGGGGGPSGSNGRSQGPRRPVPPTVPAGGGRDLASAVGVGVALMVALLIAYAVGPAALMLLAAVVVTAGALELFNLMQQRGFRPATLLGLVASVGVMFAAYWRGMQALPLVLVLVFVTSMLWYMLHVVEARPVVNAALTVAGFVWVGLFGSYASLLLRVHHGKNLFILAVVVTVAADVLAYAAGSTFGSHPLAPHISPGKTWEGTIVGGIGAVIVSVIVGKLFLSSTWSLKHALVLGVVIAVVGPIGDLCESMVKRDLDLKDSGTLLPGHGGLLDRFDALLFVLPATYYLAQYFRLL